MQALRTAIVSVILCLCSWADSPSPAPRDKKVYSANKQFFVLTEVTPKRTQVFSSSEARPIWGIPGYHPVLFLSNNGYLVVGYPGGNLLSQDAKPQDEILAFYSSGKLIRSVKIQDLFADMSVLPKTVSHLSWAIGYGFDNQNRFYVITFDDRQVLFQADGKIIQR